MLQKAGFLGVLAAGLLAGGCAGMRETAADRLDNFVQLLASAEPVECDSAAPDDCSASPVAHGAGSLADDHGETVAPSAVAERTTPAKPTRGADQPIYCYRRLGDVDCYARRSNGDIPIIDPPVPIPPTDESARKETHEAPRPTATLPRIRTSERIGN